jgi:hypothetical protein
VGATSPPGTWLGREVLLVHRRDAQDLLDGPHDVELAVVAVHDRAAFWLVNVSRAHRITDRRPGSMTRE